MVERVLGERSGDEAAGRGRTELRGGARDGDLGPDDARALLRAWLAAVGLNPASAGGLVTAPLADAELLAYLQDDGFSHADLYRRARRAHEKRLAAAVGRAGAAASALAAPALDAAGMEDGLETAALGLFDACVPAIPYAAAAAFLGREKRRLARGGGPLRVALLADGVGAVHGVTRVIDEIRERGVPGFHVDVIGTDPHVDRRLPSVVDAEIPFYPGLHVGVPGVPDLVEALAEGRYDLVHVSAPGPVGAGGAVTARMLGLPVAGSHHTEFAAYAQLRTGDPRIVLGMQLALGALYQQCAVVLSPSAAADATLAGLGVDAARIARWDRGVDADRFTPAKRAAGAAGRVTVLHAGRLTREKGVDLLADAFLAARARDPRLHLVLAGGGPEEERLRARLGDAASFLGWLEGEALATAYASADMLLFCSRTDTFGQVVLEAQASGLPVVAVGEGGPAELIADGRSGLLCPARPEPLAAAVAGLAGSRAMRERLARGGLAAVRERTWDSALGRLAAGWHAALARHAAGAERRTA